MPSEKVTVYDDAGIKRDVFPVDAEEIIKAGGKMADPDEQTLMNKTGSILNDNADYIGGGSVTASTNEIDRLALKGKEANAEKQAEKFDAQVKGKVEPSMTDEAGNSIVDGDTGAPNVPDIKGAAKVQTGGDVMNKAQKTVETKAKK